MADDIDIEEHDVLDNPRIKNIFPDITCIKTEVIDYGEENQDLEEEEYLIENDVIPDHMDYEDNEPINPYPNKIILGSKPCNTPTPGDEIELNIVDCFVGLKDWGPILDNSPYCHSCQILFPTENALDAHKMTAHSFLVAVSHNKAIKSTSKSSISASVKSSADNPKGVLCSHCNVYFPDEIAVIKHSYELLPGNFDYDNSDEVPTKPHKLDYESGGVVSCPVCKCIFKFSGKFINHMKKNHNLVDVLIPERAFVELKCKICGVSVKTNKAFNNHISYVHTDFFNRKVFNDKYECSPCNITFATALSEKIHKASKHSNAGTAKSAEAKEIKRLPSPDLSGQSNVIQRPIPKAILFKCDKCQIHFISCMIAVEHSKRCVLKRGDWKCGQCRRTFKMSDRLFHMKQHFLSERIKVIVIDDGIQDRIVCKCLSCDICFDEKTSLKYHLLKCSESPSVLCSVCNLRFHEHSIKKHVRLHSEVGSDFIVIGYIFNHGLNAALKKSVLSVKEPAKKRTEKFYYYCPSCKFYVKVNRQGHGHNTGECNKTYTRCLCKVCGLCFNQKCYRSHQEEHAQFPELTLYDMAFRNTQTEQVINPPCPDLNKCIQCKVYFFSKVALDNHVCQVEDFKTCKYCNEKFSDLAYKIHVPFHEYSNKRNQIKKEDAVLPEIMMKYKSLKSIWNILYLCETCDTVVDNYDEVVEHCQNHFCNMESYNVTINQCEICDLRFMGNSFERHETLHSENDLSKSSFEIVVYDYDKLLSDNWYDIFNKLPSHQVEQILGTSIYKHNRNVKMNVQENRKTDFTIYQCGLCKVIVEGNSIPEHIQDSNRCVKTDKFFCFICKFKFASKTMLTSHEILHKTMDINNKSFRIITFNDNNAQAEPSSDDDDMSDEDEQSKTKTESEELKFIRCQHCGKLINKSKYKRHIKYHSYYTPKNKKLKTPVPPKFVAKPNFKTVSNKKKYYMCKKCDVCVGRKNVRRHLCSSNSRKRLCPKCLLWFRDTVLPIHTQYHERYKFTRNNFEIIYFKNGKVLKSEHVNKDATNKVVLYRCRRCKLCMHNRANITKHNCHTKKKICELCDVPFHDAHFEFHNRLHDSKMFSKANLAIVEIEPKSNKNTKLQTNVKLKTKHPAFVRNLNVKRGNLKMKEKLLDYYKSRLECSKRKVNFELVSPSFLKRIHTRFYRCHICDSLFVTLSSMLVHIKCCLGDVEDGTKCDMCGLVFHKSAIITHMKWQKCSTILEAKKLYYLAIISKDIVTYDITRCVYTCTECDICFMTLDSVYRHSEEGHAMAASSYPCDKCDLRFSKLSNTKHNKLHHELQNLSSSELIVLELEIAKPLKPSNSVKKVDGDDEMDCDNDDATNEENQGSDNEGDHVIGNEEENVNDNDEDYNNDEEEDNVNDTSEEISEKTVNYELSTKIFFRRIHSNFYKCHICDCLFVTLSSMFQHVKYCVGSDGVTCSDCGLVFHPSALDVHKAYQKCDNILVAKRLYIISVASKNINVYDDARHIYICQRCDICYMTLESVLRHMELNHNEIKWPMECNECNLMFSKISLIKHQKLHHEAQGLSSSEVIVLAIDTMRSPKVVSEDVDIYNDTDKEEEVRKTIKREHTHENSSNESDDFVSSNEEPLKHNVSQDIKVVERFPDKRINSRFYQCHECNNLFVTLSNLFEHITSCAGEDGVKCTDCGYVFDSTAIAMHKWQKCTSINEAKALYFLTVISKNAYSFDVTRTVFMCRQCNICYLTLNTLFCHLETGHNAVLTLVKCEVCDLPFSHASMSKHKKLHHVGEYLTSPVTVIAITETKYQQITNDIDFDDDSYYDDAEVRRSIKRKHTDEYSSNVIKHKVVKKSKVLPAKGKNVIKCDICNLHFLHKKSLRNHRKRVVCLNMKGVKCPICNLGFAKRSLKRHMESHKDLDDTNDEVKTETEHETEAENEEFKVGDEEWSLKLFKCSACDVYFLTDGVCRDHVENHQDLDPTEYIACKICDLQFLCEYLGGHMRSHRENAFNIDEVVVTEYQPNKEVGDTYLAVDRLKSKLVTTTTHFDTEDEKGESVDSSNAR